jgi:hypothetical protein
MTAACGSCTWFEGRPAEIERGSALLRALSSAHGSSRADDGYCVHHDRYVRAAAFCGAFTNAETAAAMRQS